MRRILRAVLREDLSTGLGDGFVASRSRLSQQGFELGESGLPEWLSAGQDEDGGGRSGLFGSAGPGHARTVCLGVRAALSGRTRELERLAVELYARGLSTRDIEDTFTDETRRRLPSRAAVSEITEKLWAEYEDFSSAISPSTRWPTCLSTASPSVCGRVSGGRLCWPPGGSARMAANPCLD